MYIIRGAGAMLHFIQVKILILLWDAIFNQPGEDLVSYTQNFEHFNREFLSHSIFIPAFPELRLNWGACRTVKVYMTSQPDWSLDLYNILRKTSQAKFLEILLDAMRLLTRHSRIFRSCLIF